MKLINYLPDNYRKDLESNNYKLLQLAEDSLNGLGKVFQDIEDVRDIDNAFGVNLDRSGKNVLEYRGNRSEEELRKFIKIKIQAMRSSGDIPTINELLTAILGENYLGVQEAWCREDYNNEPAALIANIKINALNQLSNFEDMIIAGGVRLIWESKIESNLNLYFGGAIRGLKKMTFKPKQLENIKSTQALYIGTGIRKAKKVTIAPKVPGDILSTQQTHVAIGINKLKKITIYPATLPKEVEISGEFNMAGATERVNVITVDMEVE